MCPSELFPDICHVRYYEKKYATIFFRGTFAFFFKNLCFQQPLRYYRNDLITSSVFVRISFRLLQIVTWCLWYSIIRERNTSISLVTGKIAFFRKFWFSTSKILRKWSYRLQNTPQIALCALKSCSLTFVMFDIFKEITPQGFFSLKILPFFQKFVFSTTS